MNWLFNYAIPPETNRRRSSYPLSLRRVQKYDLLMVKDSFVSTVGEAFMDGDNYEILLTLKDRAVLRTVDTDKSYLVQVNDQELRNFAFVYENTSSFNPFRIFNSSSNSDSEEIHPDNEEVSTTITSQEMSQMTIEITDGISNETIASQEMTIEITNGIPNESTNDMLAEKESQHMVEEASENDGSQDSAESKTDEEDDNSADAGENANGAPAAADAAEEENDDNTTLIIIVSVICLIIFGCFMYCFYLRGDKISEGTSTNAKNVAKSETYASVDYKIAELQSFILDNMESLFKNPGRKNCESHIESGVKELAKNHIQSGGDTKISPDNEENFTKQKESVIKTTAQNLINLYCDPEITKLLKQKKRADTPEEELKNFKTNLQNLSSIREFKDKIFINARQKEKNQDKKIFKEDGKNPFFDAIDERVRHAVKVYELNLTSNLNSNATSKLQKAKDQLIEDAIKDMKSSTSLNKDYIDFNTKIKKAQADILAEVTESILKYADNFITDAELENKEWKDKVSLVIKEIVQNSQIIKQQDYVKNEIQTEEFVGNSLIKPMFAMLEEKFRVKLVANRKKFLAEKSESLMKSVEKYMTKTQWGNCIYSKVGIHNESCYDVAFETLQIMDNRNPVRIATDAEKTLWEEELHNLTINFEETNMEKCISWENTPLPVSKYEDAIMCGFWTVIFIASFVVLLVKCCGSDQGCCCAFWCEGCKYYGLICVGACGFCGIYGLIRYYICKGPVTREQCCACHNKERRKSKHKKATDTEEKQNASNPEKDANEIKATGKKVNSYIHTRENKQRLWFDQNTSINPLHPKTYEKQTESDKCFKYIMDNTNFNQEEVCSYTSDGHRIYYENNFYGKSPTLAAENKFHQMDEFLTVTNYYPEYLMGLYVCLCFIIELSRYICRRCSGRNTETPRE